MSPASRTFQGMARWIAAGFGTGFTPIATAGTAAHRPSQPWPVRELLWWSPPVGSWRARALLATFGGLWAGRVALVVGDPGWVTIDEFAGQWIAMLGLAVVTPVGLSSAFLLFRFLDVTKLGPVGWADRQHGAVGIMADDVIAGALAGGILWAVRSRWPGVLG